MPFWGVPRISIIAFYVGVPLFGRNSHLEVGHLGTRVYLRHSVDRDTGPEHLVGFEVPEGGSLVRLVYILGMQ